jgi:ubiquinone/menaquinone biosynthesis C-methylase UbiE
MLIPVDRLEHQARAPDASTLLRLAGIRPGMRVLDLGTGAGDVAFVVAELVGPTGSVVGIDRSVTALTRAARRTEQDGVTNVAFIHEDPRTVHITGEFDAVISRLALLDVPEPARVLRRFVNLVRPGGVFALIGPLPTLLGAWTTADRANVP